MNDLVSQSGVAILEFVNTNPIFKGLCTMLVGSLALAFAYYMEKRWKEPRTPQFMIFIGLSAFIVLYGLFILVFRPAWWIPPWWPKNKL